MGSRGVWEEEGTGKVGGEGMKRDKNERWTTTDSGAIWLGNTRGMVYCIFALKFHSQRPN